MAAHDDPLHPGPIRSLTNATIPFLHQLQHDADPIVLINIFVVPEGKMDYMIALWRKDSLIMKAQPGFISAQLYKGIAGSNILINIAVWESTADLRGGFTSEPFQETLKEYPDGALSYPQILQKVAVSNVCTA
jgi:heme-degrading monooxygenase HmoA